MNANPLADKQSTRIIKSVCSTFSGNQKVDVDLVPKS